MKKKMLLVMGIFLLFPWVYSQTRVTFTETFDGTSHGFTMTPSSAWMVDSTLSASGKQSCWGFVPNNTGDSIMLVSPIYNLSGFAYVYLRFTHICKVSSDDIVSIEYKEDYVGSKWTKIPNSRYEGSSQTYRKQRTFHDESYVEWVGNDLLAEPDNSWWKTEGFDISQDVSFAKVQFRFKIVKGNTLGTQFAWGWLIDNFELFASVNEIKPPVVELMEPYVNGTVYGTGPFQITAKAAKRTLLPLQKPILRMTFKDMNGVVTHDSVYMSSIEGDSIWIGTIPQKSIGTRVNYSVYAYDTAGNYGTAYSAYLIGRKWGFDSNSVAIIAIDTPKRGAIAGVSSPVVVNIENRGLKTLTSATIHWTINGVQQLSYNWSGSLVEGFSTNVTIGNYVPRLAQYDTITVWISNPNGVPNTTTDSIMTKVAYGCTQILGGDYIVGPTGQFPTINDALEILNLCGTSGNVNLKLQNGTYVQGVQLFDLNEITGAYDVLTITSLSGNAADVILKNDSTQTMVINLARSHNVVIKDLTIDAREGTVGVRVTDTCYNIEVSNCTILLDTISSVASASIYKDNNGSKVDKFRIFNNTLNGGYYGIYLYGANSTNYNTNVSIVGNTIKNTYYYGIYLYYNQFTHVSSNIITTRPANMGATYYGLYAYYNHGRYITKNKIRTTKAVSDPIGMYIYYMNYQDTNNMVLIANNEIITHVNTAAQDGMTIANTSANVMHNSILRTGQSAGAGIWLTSSASILNIKNNNIVTEGGYPIYLAGTSYLGTTWFLDYNNYYSTKGSFVGYAGGAIADMTTWRTTTGQDSNSVNIYPIFADTSKNLVLTHSTGLECPIEALVPYDIIDSTRIGITAMGAYTPLPLDFDATVLGAANWSTSVTVNQSTSVDAIFMNASLVDTLTSLTLNWSVNGVVQTPKNWFGFLLPYNSATINLGSFLPVGEYNHIVIWLTNPNGKANDMNALNDTSRLSAYGCLAPLSGTYTIGGLNADFPSISEANTIIGFCGINGPVVFELAPGLYSNVSFTGTYLGADSINTVTFTSAPGKADSVIFTGAPNAISMTNVHHLILTNVTVDAFNATYGILISDSCSNLEISHCNIICDPAITSTQAGIRYYNNTTLSDNIRLIGNTINGGYYGIYFYGVSQTSHPTRIRIDSNVLTNQYYYATYCYYSDFTSISHNIVQCRDYNASSNYYGIRTYYCNSSEIIGNKITSLNPSITNPYGMYIYYSNCFDTIPVIVANNDVRITTTSTYYGIYLGYALADLYHNSILTLGEGNARGIYMTTNTYNCFYNWYNNNIVALSGDASYPVYLSTSNAYTADYNNYYSSGDNLGYIAGAKETLDEMRQYGQDTHSVNIMPDYVDMAYDLRLRKGTGMECPQEPLFPYDIEHETRGSTTFMGAYVETELINNAKLVAFANPTAKICSPGDTIDVEVILYNRGDSILHNVNIYWSVNGVQQSMHPWTGNLLPDTQDTIYLGYFIGIANDNYIRAYTSLPNGKVDDLPQDDTISYNIYGCPTGALSGTYTVGTPTSNFPSMASLITALSNCGISGPVILDVADGHYPDLHIIGAFPGADSINTVLFRAASGNKNNVVIGASSSSGDGMILNDAAYLRFEHMTFGTTASTAAGVKVQNTLTDVKFNNCNIFSTLGGSGNAYSCLYRDAGATMMITGLDFKHCLFQGGYHNVYMINGGQSSSIYGDVKFDSCDFIDASYDGISMWYPDYVNFTIKYCNFSNRPGISTYYAIRVGNITSYTGIDTCIGNRILCTATSTNYGIMVGQTTNYGGQLQQIHAYIANNEIIIRGGSSQNQGLHFENMGYIAYYANSVHIEGTGGTSYGFYMTNTSTSYVLKLKYNNFYVNNPNGIAYTVWHSAGSFAPGLVEFDYNNYYTTGQYVASNFTTLNDWITASQEVTALNERVNFIDYPNSLKTDGKRAIMPVTPEVPLDILDSVRFSYTNMGCYDDFVPSTFDAKMEEIVSPVNGIPVGVSTSVDIKIANAGYILDSVEIHWMANGILQPTYYWKDTNGLSFGEISNVFTIGNFTPVSGQNTVVIWTENPNNYPDGNVFNDTMMITLVSCDSALYGTYTVGTPTSHFPTLEEVVDKLSNCMLAGPVTFVMASGNYPKIDMNGLVSGASTTNTITFTSASKNASTVVIGFDAATAVKLANSSHFRFEYVTIGTTTSTTTIGVELAGYCEDIEFYGCNIYANISTTTSASAAVYYKNASNSTIYLRNISFVKNNISGGYYNMYLYYPAGAAANTRTTASNRSVIRIDSNVLTDAYYYGIYSYYYSYYPSISYNTITARSSSNYFYGMYLNYYNTIDTCMNNKINLINNTYSYGIHAYYLNYNSSYGAAGPCIVANNEIISLNGTYTYGIYRYRGQWNFINNSIYLSGTTNNYGLYINYSSSSEPFTGRNNIIITNGPQSSTNYPIYTGTASYITQADGFSTDFNDLYSSTGTIAYAATPVQTLLDWKSTYAQDFNSTSFLPSFNDLNVDMSLANYDPRLICYRDLNVQTDINNNPRTVLTVMGAHATPLFEGYDLALDAFVEPAVGGVQCFPDFTPIKIQIYNQGISSANFYMDPIMLHFTCESDSVNVQSSVAVMSGSLPVMNKGVYEVYQALDIKNPGTYKLKVWMDCARDEQAFNDTIYLDYYVDKSLLPYDNDFSSTGANLYVNQLMGDVVWNIDQNPPATPVFGTQSMHFPSSESRGSISQSLFTSVSLQGTYFPRLQFWYAHDNGKPTKRDQMEVKISTDGGQTFTVLKTLYRYNAAYTSPTWVPYTIDLSPYTQGSCIIVSFVGYSYGGGDQAIDRIRIVAAQDMKLTLIPPDFTSFSACDLQNKSLSVVMANLTNQPIPYNTGDVLTLEITGANPRTIQYPLSGRLEGLQSDTILLATDLDFTNSGVYDIVAYTNAIDSIPANDTDRVSYTQTVDVALAEILPLGFKNVGDTVYPMVKIVNTGTIPVYSPFDLILNVNGIDTIIETLTDSIDVGDTVTYLFTQGFIVPQITAMQPYYFLNIQTDMACDGVATNDKKQYLGDVNFKDLSIYDINNPTSTSYFKANDSVNVEVYIYNSGTFDSEGVKIYVEVDSAGVIIANFSETSEAIASKATVLHTFATKYRVPEFLDDTMSYDIRVYLEATEGDLDLTNDTMGTSTYALNDVNIDAFGRVNWTMDQNIPNPASAATRIPYSIPQEGVIRFTLTTITGQILHSQDIPSAAGSHSLEFDTQHLAGGIYYYSMEYQGQRIVKKMTIQK